MVSLPDIETYWYFNTRNLWSLFPFYTGDWLWMNCSGYWKQWLRGGLNYHLFTDHAWADHACCQFLQRVCALRLVVVCGPSMHSGFLFMFIGFLDWLLCLWQVGLASSYFRFVHVSVESNTISLKSLIGFYAYMIMTFEKINVG